MNKSDSGCFVAILAIGVPLFIAFTYWPYIAIFAVVLIAAVIIAVAVNSACASAQAKNVQYAIVVGRTRVMTTKSRPSGYSISDRGNVRAYWRFRNEVDHINVEFEVHYEDGKVRRITTPEDSALYKRLMPYVGIKPKPPVSMQAPPIQIAEKPKPAEIPSKSEPIKIENGVEPMPETKPAEPAEAPKPSRKEEKRFVEVPFEVAPNEYSLAISYPSCQMIRWAGGEYRIKVRFSASYDPTVKGVRNRVITCATVDSAGRMTDVSKEFRQLDLSGTKMVDIMFCDNADQEPAKIIVGIDRYY